MTASRRRHRRRSPPLPSAPTTPKPALPTEMPPDNRTSVQKYLDEYVPVTLVGRAIRGDKEHVFVTPDDGEPVPDDTDFTALCRPDHDRLHPLQRRGRPARLQDGAALRRLSSCQSVRRSATPTRRNGSSASTASRPTPGGTSCIWCCSVATPVRLFTYTAGSVTGRRAVGNLLRHYDRLQKTHPDMYPVVRLKVGGLQPPRRARRLGPGAGLRRRRSARRRTVSPSPTVSPQPTCKTRFRSENPQAPRPVRRLSFFRSTAIDRTARRLQMRYHATNVMNLSGISPRVIPECFFRAGARERSCATS